MSVNENNGSDEEIFDLLMKGKDPVLTIGDSQYRLLAFQQTASQELEQRIEELRSDIREQQVKIVLVVLGVLMASVGGVFVGVKLTVYLRENMPARIESVTEAFKKKGKGVIDRAGEMRTQRIVIDETIRETTRTNLALTRQIEKAALRVQIKQAIDVGNKELATTLMSTLQKLEGD